jgi:hypothetical protein
MLRVEIAANRYDLLSAEGLAITLGNYLGLFPQPKYISAPVDKQIVMTVEESVIFQ